MSWVTLAPPQERPGHLVCACDLTPPASPPVAAGAPGLGLAAGIFALTVLAQALTAAVLPTAGVSLAPKPIWAALPYALTLVGAGVATLPAAALADLFGRRAALALGASLGLAGGAVAARSFVAGSRRHVHQDEAGCSAFHSAIAAASTLLPQSGRRFPPATM